MFTAIWKRLKWQWILWIKKGVDTIRGVGDYVGYMTNPMECLDLLKGFDLVIGNHDRAVIDRSEQDRMNDYAYYAMEWTKAHLKDSYVALIKTLPYMREYSDEDYTIVHGSLHEPTRFNYIFTVAEAMKTFESLKTQVVFTGHSHNPHIWIEKSAGGLPVRNLHYPMVDDHQSVALDRECRYIFNVGSVGQPRDGNPKGCIVVFDTGTMTVEYQRFDYPLETTVGKMIKEHMPAFLYQRLLMGR